MNTRTRRFVLRLIVGLLTFLIGVLAAMVLGHFNPLDGHQTQPPQVRRCGDHAWVAPPPAQVIPPDAPVAPRVAYPVFRPEAPPAPQPPAEPMLPSFVDEGEVKSPRPVAPSHRPR